MLTNQQNTRFILEQAKERHEHARRCKKAPVECIVCQGNIVWFAALPSTLLAMVLEERQ